MVRLTPTNMARPKGSKNKATNTGTSFTVTSTGISPIPIALEGNDFVYDTPAPVELVPVVPIPIAKLSVDYPSEGLNNMAIKINEIIDHLYGKR